MPSTPPGCCYASLSLTTSFSSLPLPNLLPVHLGSFFTHIRGWFKPLTQTPGALQGSHRTISLGRSQSTDSFPLRASNLLLPDSSPLRASNLLLPGPKRPTRSKGRAVRHLLIALPYSGPSCNLHNHAPGVLHMLPVSCTCSRGLSGFRNLFRMTQKSEQNFMCETKPLSASLSSLRDRGELSSVD